ncbi:hypothetical protein CPB83DRAFT_851689 [Crepidotus variabilis]|uniref:Uncharacterized protein n=1 Tax=Crepidotus variabilis TaxID=179855 RepID=A0A9P6JRK6_9AGAR|nr:hypothetical protein CPB83DRAFT_851689 [Crepidotus variabilis]
MPKPGPSKSSKAQDPSANFRDQREHSCCGTIQNATFEARERCDKRRATPQPWLVRKLLIPFTLGILGYSGYVFVSKVCLGMIRRENLGWGTSGLVRPQPRRGSSSDQLKVTGFRSSKTESKDLSLARTRLSRTRVEARLDSENLCMSIISECSLELDLNLSPTQGPLRMLVPYKPLAPLPIPPLWHPSQQPLLNVTSTFH